MVEDVRHCRHCGFSLDGVSYRAACPGCAAPVKGLLEPEHPPVFNLPPAADPLPSGPVRTDEVCLSCGYGIRGLDAEGHCPECGAPVMQSLMGRFLRFAGSWYLGALHRGGKWVLWSLIIRGMVLAVGIALSPVSPEVSKGGVMIVGIIAVSASTYGWVLLTSEHVLVRSWRSRHWARWLTVGANAIELLGYTSWAGQTPSLSTTFAGMLPGGTCLYVVLFGVVWVTSITVGMVFLTSLARTMPEFKLAGLCSVASWLTPLLVVGGSVAGAGCPLITPVGYVAAFVYYLVVMDRWRSTLRKLRAEAEAREVAAGYVTRA